MLVMYIGRLGPLTVVSLWSFARPTSVRYPDGNLAIG
jgi:trk system potassium uptake protein TrkH